MAISTAKRLAEAAARIEGLYYYLQNYRHLDTVLLTQGQHACQQAALARIHFKQENYDKALELHGGRLPKVEREFSGYDMVRELRRRSAILRSNIMQLRSSTKEDNGLAMELLLYIRMYDRTLTDLHEASAVAYITIHQCHVGLRIPAKSLNPMERGVLMSDSIYYFKK